MVGEEISRELGGSVLVANVQALASSYSGDVPLRYLRPELHAEEVLVDESLPIPTIDMRKLLVDDDEMGKLHLACLVGVLYGTPKLINHGVAEEVIKKMKADVQEFFKLPLKEKNAYAKLGNGLEGYGQNFVVSEDQKLDWADMLFLQCLPASERNMRFWPEEPTSFRISSTKMSLIVKKIYPLVSTLLKFPFVCQGNFGKVFIRACKVSNCLLKLMAKNLLINPEQLTNMFDDGRQAVRMNYYPPCVHASKRNGKWIPIRPVPGAFIVNIGDVIEIMSNGEYKSIEHRAVVDPEKERLSIATFCSPGAGAIIGPLPELTKEKGAIYKSVSREEYIKFVLSRKLDGKSTINLMKLEN
ncbi:S-norcoclaurine synthase 1 [Vitis vinifera]|uniref:S-norcoclaurine synthase 1 n=1 Tax=Vitis vinifera TaxID=29760 RepID=A0A438IU26_VITVI|nr:S-norcoclaurine synthase 1 [Vitis vinifera]